MPKSMDDLLSEVAGIFGNPDGPLHRPDAHEQRQLLQAGLFLVGTLLTDLQLTRKALETLASPPEITVEDVDTDEWAAQQKARDERDERHTAALERIATALEAGNVLSFGANSSVTLDGAGAEQLLTMALDDMLRPYREKLAAQATG